MEKKRINVFFLPAVTHFVFLMLMMRMRCKSTSNRKQNINKFEERKQKQPFSIAFPIVRLKEKCKGRYDDHDDEANLIKLKKVFQHLLIQYSVNQSSMCRFMAAGGEIKSFKYVFFF